MARYVAKSHLPEYYSSEKPSIPSFTATYNVLVHKHYSITNIGFTPIIPYPATEDDTINTCIRNFQMSSLKMNLRMVSLWCDEGVYRIAAFKSKRIR